MIASFNSNKNPSFFDKMPTERGENAYMTHPANRRNGYRTRLVVYQGREISPDLTVLRKPCAMKVNREKNAYVWPFCPRRLAFMPAVAHRLQLSEVLDSANGHLNRLIFSKTSVAWIRSPPKTPVLLPLEVDIV